MQKVILLFLIIVFNFQFSEAYSKQRFKTIDPRIIGSEEEQKEIAGWEFQICLEYVEYDTYYKYEPYLTKDKECNDTKYDLLVNSEEDYLYYWEDKFAYIDETSDTIKCIYGNCQNGYGVLGTYENSELALALVGNFNKNGFLGKEIYILSSGIFIETTKFFLTPLDYNYNWLALDNIYFEAKLQQYLIDKEKIYHFGNLKKAKLYGEQIGSFKNFEIYKGIEKNYLYNDIYEGTFNRRDYDEGKLIVYEDQEQFITYEGKFNMKKLVNGSMTVNRKNNKDKYEGNFSQNLLKGKGKITSSFTRYTAGEKEEITRVLIANFVNGIAKSGILTVSGYLEPGLNYTYEGELSIGYNQGRKGHTLKGKGKAKYEDGSIYEGEFLDNQKNGIGKMVYADGKIYEGKWKNGKPLVNVKTDKRYFALVVGNNDYQHLEKLDAAVNDAKVISEILENKYNFEVELLLNADYETTVNKFYTLSRKLNNDDNFFIFYAGHGYLDKKQNRGYWLPVDAKSDLPSKWISNALIADELKATEAKHVLLIVDSCFSGSLMRSGDNLNQIATLDKKYIKLLESKKTRLVISSGGNEPVVDSDGGNHSVFARKLIDTLQNNKGVLSTQEIFENIRKYVASNADQTPERAAIYKAGHDGGDFLFFPK